MNKTVRMMGRVFLFAVAMTAMLSSCIKEEALNAEADITGVSLGADSLLIREPEITNNEITIYANTRDKILAPQFTLTEALR